MNVRLLTICLLAGACASCGIYHPQLAEVPLIDHKGDIRFTAKATSPAMVNASISAGLTNHIAAQIHTDICLFEDISNINYSHFALGYYQPFGKAVLEGYAGAGFNYGDITDYARSFRSRGKSIIPFVQVNYGWTNLTKAHIDVGAAVKAGIMYPHFSTDFDDGHYVQTNSKAGFVEPQLFFRIGGENVKFSLQAGWCHVVMRRAETQWWYPFTVGMGITVFVK